MHAALAALIIMNLSIVARFTQLKHPFIIKWTYINSLHFEAEYFNKEKLKIVFILICLYNIACFSFFDTLLFHMSFLWFISIWWWDFFVSGKFNFALLTSLIDLFGYSYLTHKHHYFIGNVIYFVYIVYISIMYKIEGQN